MSHRGRLLLLASLLLADALGIALGLGVAAFFVTRLIPMYVNAIALGLVPWLVSFYALRLYDLETVLEDSQEYATLATGCTYGILLLIVANTLFNNGNLALPWLFTGWLLSIIGVSFGRFAMRRVVRAMRRQGHLMASALIIGADEQGRAIARQLRSEADSGLRVVGFVDDFLATDTPIQDGLRVLGHPTMLPALIREYHIAEVVIVPGAMAWESFHEILEQLATTESARVRLSPGYYDLLATTPRVAHRNFVPLIIVDSARLSGVDALFKFVIDYGLGSLLFLLTLPLWLVVGWRSAAYEVVDIIGLGGRNFQARTFRGSPKSLLKRTGLDRLPLLWLVLRGQMSLVGPRPIPETERDRHRRALPTLASVKPGITGPWAVVPVASLEEELRASLYYIRNWTLWLDLQILIQTALVVVRRKWGLLD